MDPELVLVPVELILKLREALRARGARGIIGLQRIFKIMDDDHSGTLDI